MKIDFEDGGYIEFQRSRKAHHVYVMVAVRKPDNPLELLVNSAEIHIKQLLDGANSVSGPITLEGNYNEENNPERNSEHPAQNPDE